MTDAMFRSVLKSQYHAALAMLREAVERCPADEWSNADHNNAFWQVAYHTLFFTHLYLQRDEAAFQRWAQHRGPDDGIEGDPYTQAQVLEYVPSAIASSMMQWTRSISTARRAVSVGTACRSWSINW